MSLNPCSSGVSASYLKVEGPKLTLGGISLFLSWFSFPHSPKLSHIEAALSFKSFEVSNAFRGVHQSRTGSVRPGPKTEFKQGHGP